MNPHYVLTSRWQLDTSAAAVWALLTDIEAWPRWWRFARRAQLLERHAGSPLGDVAQIDWSTWLAGDIRLRLVTRIAERPHLLETHASGDLRGVGAWILEPGAAGVAVTCRWDIELHRRWMRLFAGALHPFFAWNHFAVMREGGRGMARVLGCRLSHSREWSGARRH